MMPSSTTSFPPELVELIIQHLSFNKNALRRCAQVSRTWSEFSQRALFRNVQVNLSTYTKMAKFLDDLISVPHLQLHVRGVQVRTRDHVDDISLPAYMSCLTSVLSLLPNLTKFAFHDFSDDYDDIVATRAYLNLIPNVLGSAPLVELDITIYSVEIFHHVFGILEGTNVKRINLRGGVDPRKVDSGATRRLLHLPSLEHIHFEVNGLEEEFHTSLMHTFDLPNLRQCEIVTGHVDILVHWRDILLRGFPPLKLFKLELTRAFNHDPEYSLYTESFADSAYRPLPLAGLPFQHIHLSVSPKNLDMMVKFIEWWSSTFHALSNFKTTIHFTELTFAFTDLPGLETLEEAWSSLDESLAHLTLNGVHFERNSWQTREKITKVAYPVLAEKIRFVLPRLASRGVLRLD